MKNTKSHGGLVALLVAAVCLFAFVPAGREPGKAFPYKKAGLTERQAAAHLLDRFTYGARPGQVDEVVEMGLENWFRQQLQADLPDPRLEQRLSAYQSLTLDNESIVAMYPKPGQLLRMAVRDGAIEKDAINKDRRKEMRKVLESYMDEKGYRRQAELFRELVGQKILRAAYGENQLLEVLTAFWFNHFNVSLTDNDCARFILTYERDAIRPNALGKFENILLATAKSPAMLTYLDNFKSAAPSVAMPAVQPRQSKRRRNAGPAASGAPPQIDKRKDKGGLNENYAREIMELHTLGVDGGYTQRDVTEVARIFTGWTVYPGLSGYKTTRSGVAAVPNLSRAGFMRDGDFLFAAKRHDAGKKVVMGKTFPAGGGYEEGVALIKMLARHPSTARFISQKLAVRFLHDTPPKGLVDRMAKTFLDTDGDIRQVLMTLVSSPEFWSKEAIREKIKSPLELAISSVRTLDAKVSNPYPLYMWIVKMGERMYAYQAPTGFPDNGQYWINTGSLLMRMNFGLALASGRIAGVHTDLRRLNDGREPESVDDALAIYSRRMMPERALEETIKRLGPTLHDPAFFNRVDSAANSRASATDFVAPAHADAVARVVGIVIGSPEFQRR